MKNTTRHGSPIFIGIFVCGVLLSGCISSQTNKLNPQVELNTISEHRISIGNTQMKWTDEGLQVFGWLRPKSNNYSGSAGYVVVSATTADGKEIAPIECIPTPHMISHKQSHRPRFSTVIPMKKQVPVAVTVTHYP